MPKELQSLLFTKLELQSLPKNFKVKMQIKKLDRKINKLIKKTAKSQAKKVYKQTIELLQQVVNANFK